jgi:hypothetical protein
MYYYCPHTVDTASAGEGELTVNIMHNGRPVPVQIYPEGRGMYRVTFTPGGAGIYSIQVNFAGTEVQGWFIDVLFIIWNIKNTFKV